MKKLVSLSGISVRREISRLPHRTFYYEPLPLLRFREDSILFFPIRASIRLRISPPKKAFDCNVDRSPSGGFEMLNFSFTSLSFPINTFCVDLDSPAPLKPFSKPL